MAFKGVQVSVTTTAQSLTTLASLAAGAKHYRAVDVMPDATTANTIYGGGSTVTNVPANAGFFATATRPYRIGDSGGNIVVNADNTYLVATTGATTVYLAFYS